MTFVARVLQTGSKILHGRLPGQLVVQITNRCNAHCPQCGMRVTNRIERSELDIQTLTRVIDAAAQRGFQAISFTGGEPLLRLPELPRLIEHASRAGIPYVRTGTNGFVFMQADSADFLDRVKRLADRLAETKLRNFWVSIDSADPETHERMRGLPGVIKGIRKALPEFHSRGLFPAANLGLNRNLGGRALPALDGSRVSEGLFRFHLLSGLRLFYERVLDLGFTMVNTCYPMSDDTMDAGESLSAVYAATSSDEVVRFSRRERDVLFSSLLEVIPEFRSRIRIFSPLCSLLALTRQYSHASATSYGCRGGVDFLFVDSKEGDIFPCGYRGKENLGKLWDLNTAALNGAHECAQCDWECFRDPSELMGPITGLFSQPISTIFRLLRDKRWARLWMSDMAYYRACDFFNGRKAPDYSRMAVFCGQAKRTPGLFPTTVDGGHISRL